MNFGHYLWPETLVLDRGCFHNRQDSPRTGSVEFENGVMEGSQVVIFADRNIGDSGVRKAR